MSYRDVSHSLRAYRDRIHGELEEARRAAQEASDRASKVAVLEKELAETEGLIAKMGGTGKRGLPMLDDVRVAAPCKANWDEMVGDDHVRFCGQCEKNVYNLSSLSRDEAEALLIAREGKMCVRLYRRDDGTVLTDDCPVGVKKRRRRRAAIAAVGGGLMAAASALGMRGMTQVQGAAVPVDTNVHTRMGAIAFTPAPGPSADPTTAPTTTTSKDPGPPEMGDIGPRPVMGKMRR
jgi:hypothetical protein